MSYIRGLTVLGWAKFFLTAHSYNVYFSMLEANKLLKLGQDNLPIAKIYRPEKICINVSKFSLDCTFVDWVSRYLNWHTSKLFLKEFVQIDMKGNILAQPHWPFVRGFSSQRASNAESITMSWRHNICLNKYTNWIPRAIIFVEINIQIGFLGQ